jgi:hypothetical protein
MPQREAIAPPYPTVEFVLDAITRWIKKYRYTRDANDELGWCGREEEMKIARDLGLSASDLRILAAKVPDTANYLSKMLHALSLNPLRLAKNEPATARDLQRTCVFCDQKSRCRHELAGGTAKEHFREFCSNSYTLEVLLKQKQRWH